MSPREGDTINPRSTHLPLPFLFFPTNFFLSSPGGKTVTFFTEEAWKAKGTKCPGTSWRRRKWGQSSPNCCTKEIGPKKIYRPSSRAVRRNYARSWSVLYITPSTEERRFVM